MKIAAPTSDKVTIFERTGRAPLFAVATVAESNISAIEYRRSPKHEHKDGQHSHRELAEMLSDCDLLLVKHIGPHLADDLDAAGIKYNIVTTDKIGDAIHQNLAG